ncbi:alpha-L-rhamnosidase [Spartobacteria bacterium LR76]|nr:alpha-L-rhamnosidase [Spartobacteria bacterium LR76]
MPSHSSSPKWISSTICGDEKQFVPAPFFRREFWLDRLPSQAALRITALGLYHAKINDHVVGDRALAPGWTDYRVRVPLQSYDVSSLLKPGKNVIGVILGDGWYCGRVGWFDRQRYGEKPELLARLEMEFPDATRVQIATDGSWKTTSGPILENDLLMGEIHDARKELTGWTTPGYDDSAWTPAQEGPDRDVILDTIDYPGVRRTAEIIPTPLDGGRYDMGQNFSGRIRIQVTAPRDTALTFRFAETLDPDGSLYTENLRSARATDTYICKGGGEETWEPLFTFHGFRYVEVDGLPADARLNITGLVLQSDTPPTGEFSCSHPLLNQLQHNITWGQRSNFLEAPTDCPQRDERLGWTGDAQVFIRTAAFNMNVRRFFHKWVQDIRDAQRASGGVPEIIPCPRPWDNEDGGPAWSDATIICPWTVYLCYGDTQILSDHYDSMRRYLEFIGREATIGLIRAHPDSKVYRGFGDWLALDGSGKLEGATPKDLIGTAFYAYDACLMAKIAAVLGKPDEARAYTELHAGIVKAFQRRFVTQDGLIDSGTQTAYTLALHFDLIPENVRAAAARALVQDIRQRDYHIATGFVGTPYILDVLTRAGYLDIAYRLLEQETFPSWLFPVKNGATTIWERWDGWTPERGFQDKGMNSFNHYAYGAVGDWMYRHLAGLELDEDAPGYRHIIFQPKPGGSITWASARLETAQGMAGISWKISGGTLEVELTIPENARGTFVPPAGFPQPSFPAFGPGTHVLRLQSE